MTDAINLAEKLATFSDTFSPRTVTQFNDCDVMVVKVKGEFVWHKHDDTDDFFLVLKGELDIELRDRTVTLKPGRVVRGAERRRASPGRARGSSPAADRTVRHAEHRRCGDCGAASGDMIVAG